MNEIYVQVGLFFLGTVIGLGVAVLIITTVYKNKAIQVLKDARKAGEQIKTDKLLQAKEKFLELKAAHEKIIQKKNKEIEIKLGQISSKEHNFIKKNDEFKREKANHIHAKSDLAKYKSALNRKEKDLDLAHTKQIVLLENISSMTRAEAKKELVASLKAEAQTDAMSFVQKTIAEAKLTAVEEAKKIIIQTMQRVASEESIDNSVSIVNIESDDLKGRIIGKEGRNIRSLEAATGVEVIVDDTPEAIILSCFDPVRREIAKIALKKLVQDGRIHPSRVEEVVKKTQKEISQEILNTGKRTVIDLGIHGLDPELIRMVGRMKYRSSYGQNLLQHSREVANLCSIMAAELGLNTKLAKRAGLLHDIGKVPDDNPELPHAILGMKLAEKYGENKDVCNAIGAHHDEIEMDNLLSPLVQVCDAVSGARPGARREVVEAYLTRLKELEDLALSNAGVLKAYALQAGRELRVIVESEKISDKEAKSLSYNLSKKIQDEMTYPGQVKVTVIRETRSIHIAK